jgi:hypothetical protein
VSHENSWELVLPKGHSQASALSGTHGTWIRFAWSQVTSRGSGRRDRWNRLTRFGRQNRPSVLSFGRKS